MAAVKAQAELLLNRMEAVEGNPMAAKGGSMPSTRMPRCVGTEKQTGFAKSVGSG